MATITAAAHKIASWWSYSFLPMSVTNEVRNYLVHWLNGRDDLVISERSSIKWHVMTQEWRPLSVAQDPRGCGGGEMFAPTVAPRTVRVALP